MFDIGFSELLLIFIIALVVLGPERLPKAARTLGYWMGRARSTFNNLRNELEREALNQDVRQRLEKEMRDMGLDEDSIRRARDKLLTPEEAVREYQRDHDNGRPGHITASPDDQDHNAAASKATAATDADQSEKRSDA